jgi:hypothetical protein
MELLSTITHIGTLIAALGVLATVWGILMSVRESRKALVVNVFSTFNTRYADIMKSLPEELQGRLFSASKDEVVGKEIKVDAVLSQYLELCSEEYYLHDNGLLPESIWVIWSKEIGQCLSSEVFREYWKRNKKSFKSQPTFSSFIDSLLS